MNNILKYLLYIIAGIVLGLVIGVLIMSTHSDEGVFPFELLNTSKNNNFTLGLEVGSNAPEFKLYTYDGNLIKLSDSLGTPVVINFWATWCAPCVVEMPLLQDRFDTLNSNIYIFAVNAGESKGEVQKFAQENDISFPTLLDPTETVQKMYRVRAYPTTYFIDKNGTIQAVHVGILSESQLDHYLKILGVADQWLR